MGCQAAPSKSPAGVACFHRGKTIPTGKKVRCRRWMFSEATPRLPLIKEGDEEESWADLVKYPRRAEPLASVRKRACWGVGCQKFSPDGKIHGQRRGCDHTIRVWGKNGGYRPPKSATPSRPPPSWVEVPVFFAFRPGRPKKRWLAGPADGHRGAVGLEAGRRPARIGPRITGHNSYGRSVLWRSARQQGTPGPNPPATARDWHDWWLLWNAATRPARSAAILSNAPHTGASGPVAFSARRKQIAQRARECRLSDDSVRLWECGPHRRPRSGPRFDRTTDVGPKVGVSPGRKVLGPDGQLRSARSHVGTWAPPAIRPCPFARAHTESPRLAFGRTAKGTLASGATTARRDVWESTLVTGRQARHPATPGSRGRVLSGAFKPRRRDPGPRQAVITHGGACGPFGDQAGFRSRNSRKGRESNAWTRR